MTTQRILFGEFKPDLPDNEGSPTANLDMAYNVYSSSTGYAPFPKTSTASDDMPNGEDVNSLFLAKDQAEIIIMAGTDSEIYRANNILRTGTSGATITPVGKAGGYTSPQVNWIFKQFGRAVLATNGTDKIQRYLIGDSEPFADIAQAPVCKTMAIVRDFVMAGYCDEDYNKVQWSDLNNENVWDSSDSNQADFQKLPSGGAVQAITGGEFGLILQEKAVTRCSYIGTPLIWQFDLISDNTGCISGSSAIAHNGSSYWLSESGFMACDGSIVTPIGEGKINDWFFNEFDRTQIDNISVTIDPLKSLIVWDFPTAKDTRGLIMYNFNTQRWTVGGTDAQVVAGLATQGRTLDSLDDPYPVLDDMPVSLDSPLFIGGQFALCGASGSHIVAFNLIPDDCTLTTNDLEFGMFSVATLAQPIIENGSAGFQIASRQTMSSAIDFMPVSITSSENRADLRGGGRYHRVRTIPTGAWTKAIGFDLTVTPQGQR